MIKPVLNIEPLNKVLDGRDISYDEINDIINFSTYDQNELFKASTYLRNKYKKNKITFSKKVFFNLINLCRDSCSYCTYKTEPFNSKVSMMNKNDIVQLARLAKKHRCVEALFITGENPEQKYIEAKNWLRKNGFENTAEYLIHMSEMVFREGLFPHTNAGNLTTSVMKELKKTNASIGLMLENVSDRLSENGMPHHLAPSKRSTIRLKTLENAGKLKMPITTGLLIGIGETLQEIIDSIYAIKKIQQKFSNIQEMILQNFQPKLNTKMSNVDAPNEIYFKIIVALVRIIMPEMNIQIPPNLSLGSYQNFLAVGINDWGGLSPLTVDYVNPEMPWPAINNVKQKTHEAGFELEARFPVYPEFMPYVNTKIKSKMSEIKNDKWLVKREYWE